MVFAFKWSCGAYKHIKSLLLCLEVPSYITLFVDHIPIAGQASLILHVSVRSSLFYFLPIFLSTFSL